MSPGKLFLTVLGSIHSGDQIFLISVLLKKKRVNTSNEQKKAEKEINL